MRAILVLLLFGYSVVQVCSFSLWSDSNEKFEAIPQTNLTCGVISGNLMYNLSGMILTKSNYIGTDGNGGELWINICAEVTNAFCGQAAAVCLKTTGGSYFNFGNAPSISFNVTGTVQNPSINITYNQGGVCGKDYRSAVIQINCLKGAIPGTIVSSNFNLPSANCVYYITMNSEYACPVELTNPWHLSVGSILLIVVVVMLVVYCIGGFAIMKIRGTPGFTEAIPNGIFWKGFFSLVMDGIMFIITKFKSLTGHSTATYQNI